jgi:AcrR family transcriptional regulator
VSPDAPAPDPDLPDELARLPRGRHGLPPEFVAHNQRERLIAGFAQAVAEVGFNDTPINRITKEAGVSSRTFYKYFQTREECFLAALDAIVAQLTEHVAYAWGSEDEWEQRVRASIAAVLRFLAAEPAMARLCTVEVLHAGPAVTERWEQLIAQLAPYLRQGESGGGADPFPDTTDRGILGGMLSLITRRIISDGAENLEQLLPDLVQFALTPYLGPADARRVASQTA